MPYCMCRSCTCMPFYLKILGAKLLCVVLRYLSGNLTDCSHDRSSCSHINPVSSPGRIINLPKSAVGKLCHNSTQHTVIIKCSGHDIITRCIKVFSIHLRKWRQYLLTIAVVQIEAKGVGHILQIIKTLINDCFCNLLELSVPFEWYIFCIDLFIYILISNIFLFDYFVIQFKHLWIRSIERLFDFPFNILRRISQNPQPVDLPVCGAGYLTSFHNPPDNILHDTLFQILIPRSDLTCKLILVIIFHITPSPDFVLGDS